MRDHVYKVKLLNMKVRTCKISETSSDHARTFLIMMDLAVVHENKLETGW